MVNTPSIGVPATAAGGGPRRVLTQCRRWLQLVVRRHVRRGSLRGRHQWHLGVFWGLVGLATIFWVSKKNSMKATIVQFTTVLTHTKIDR